MFTDSQITEIEIQRSRFVNAGLDYFAAANMERSAETPEEAAAARADMDAAEAASAAASQRAIEIEQAARAAA